MANKRAIKFICPKCEERLRLSYYVAYTADVEKSDLFDVVIMNESGDFEDVKDEVLYCPNCGFVYQDSIKEFEEDHPNCKLVIETNQQKEVEE